MSFSPAELEPSAEIPQNYLIVIADDWLDDQSRTEQAVRDSFSESGSTAGLQVEKPTKIKHLLQTALSGKDGSQADVVLLDNGYGLAKTDWAIDYLHPPDLQYIASRAQVEIEHLLPRSGDTESFENRVKTKLLTDPSGMRLAILLRTLGYTGQIFIVSGGSIEDTIDIGTDQLRHARENIPGIQLDSHPIDGYANKDTPFSSTEIATPSVGPIESWNIRQIDGTCSTALTKLFIQAGFFDTN